MVGFDFRFVPWGANSEVKTFFCRAPFDQIASTPVQPSFAWFDEFEIAIDFPHQPDDYLFDTTTVDVAYINTVRCFLARYTADRSATICNDIFFVSMESDVNGILGVWTRGFEITND